MKNVIKSVFVVLCMAVVMSVLPQTGEAVEEVTILIRMMDMQDQWFRKELIPKAEEELGVKIHVATFNNEEDIEQMVKMEKEAGKKTIALVKTPQAEVDPMVKLELLLALEDIVDADTLQKDLVEYVESAVQFGTFDGKTYYVPRKLETNTFLYLESQVEEAVDNWIDMEEEIQAMFKKHNGYGLPADYELEDDPNEWDWFDLAVVSYYWANTEGEDGLTVPRMATGEKITAGRPVNC
jgi:ABC-type glycerol-3-phosphate transport system substrate-binding protein